MPAAATGACPNEARREEQGAAGRALPDCRAYEVVTTNPAPSPVRPEYFNGLPNRAGTGYDFSLPEEPHVVGAGDGDAFGFSSREGNESSPLWFSDLAKRQAEGWGWESVMPPQSRLSFLCASGFGVAGWSKNLDQVVIDDGASELPGGFPLDLAECGHDEPRLVPGEPEESGNLFLRDNADGSYQLVNVTAPGTTSYQPFFDAISEDGSHVVFETRARLTPGAPPTSTPETDPNTSNTSLDLYVWDAGTLRLLTVLPDGAPVPGLLPGAHHCCGGAFKHTAAMIHAISESGERIFFYAGGELAPENHEPELQPYLGDPHYLGGALYLREHPSREQSSLLAGGCDEPEKACTIQVDRNQGGSGPSGGGQFRWASRDGSRAFFTDENQLTPDATAVAGKPDLYEYDIEKPEGERLSDLTANAGEPADVLGVSGGSADGSYLYFVARGVLTGAQPNSQGEMAQAGAGNLYLSHEGQLRFIAALDPTQSDACDWAAGCLTARVSSNGAFVAFDSVKSLTGYDNVPVRPLACSYVAALSEGEYVEGVPCVEIFRYSAATDQLSCASCNPDGSPPESEFAWSAIRIPHRKGGTVELAAHMQNNMTDNGDVFFDTMNSLLPGDENGTWDAYEYAGGEGATAQLHLLSSGKSEDPSYFLDASASGSDAFFTTTQPLVRSDTRTDVDVYDARIGGGFSEPLNPTCESPEACHEAGTSHPTFNTPSSSVFAGPEEGPHHPVCKRPYVLRHGRCIHRHRRKHSRRRKLRPARHNHGGLK